MKHIKNTLSQKEEVLLKLQTKKETLLDLIEDLQFKLADLEDDIDCATNWED